MKKLMYIAAMCGTVILAGCTSLDDRLASNDPTVRLDAERELIQFSRAKGTEADRIAAVKRITDRELLYKIAMEANSGQWVAEDPSFDANAGYNGFEKSKDGKVRTYYKLSSIGKLSDYTRVSGRTIDTTKEGVAAVERLALDENKKDDLIKLFDLVGKAESDKVKLAAFKCVNNPKRSQTLASLLVRATKDASVQSVALAKMDPEKRLAAIAQSGTDAKERLDAFNKLRDQKAIDEVVLKTNDKAILLAGMSKGSDKAALASRVFGKDFAVEGDTIDLDFALEYLKRVGDGRKEIWSKLAERGQLQEIETRMARLYHDKVADMSDESRRMLLSGITSMNVIAKMVVPSTNNAPFYIADKAIREATIKHLPSSIAFSMATNAIARQTVEAWNKKNISHLVFASHLMSGIKDEKILTGGLLRVLNSIGKFQDMCRKHKGWKWTAQDVRQANMIVAMWKGRITDSMREQALMQVDSPYAGQYLLGGVSPEMAYRLITSKKIEWIFLVTELAKKIDPDKIDLDLYDLLRNFESAQKVLASRAPASVQHQIQARREQAIAELLQKAKTNGAKTFELKGFYLGMPIKDAKKLVEYYLPDAKVVVTSENNLEINPKTKKLFLDSMDADPQEMYFCQADKAGKVWRLNFDKRFLKKWFSYDVQDWHEWVREYGKEFQFDFRQITVEKKVSNDHYQIYMNYSQPAYRYRHNKKGFIVSYYGKLKTDGFVDVDASDVFAGGFRAERVGFGIGADKKLREFFENGDGAKEGTLRVEVLKD